MRKRIDESQDRLKKLKAITTVTSILSTTDSLEASFAEICSTICSAMRYPQIAVARIKLGSTTTATPGYRASRWCISRKFDTPNRGAGLVEVCYTQKEDWGKKSAFLAEEHDLIANISQLVAGAATKSAFEQLVWSNDERLKEIGGINRVVSILQKNQPLEELLQQVCDILPAAWQYPEDTAARISFGDSVYTSSPFEETPWRQSRPIFISGKKHGSIDIFYLHPHGPSDRDPFLQEEHNLITNLAELIGGAAGSRMYETLVAHNTERLKELRAINQTTFLVTSGGPVDEVLQDICAVIPPSWQYADDTAAQITFADKTYTCGDFRPTPWMQKETFMTIDNMIGTVEVCYLHEHPPADEGPFLAEERNLIANIARLVAHYLNDTKGRDILERSSMPSHLEAANSIPRPQDIPQLQNLYVNQQRENYLSFDLMRFEVREVLLVASLFHAFVAENDDPLFARFSGTSSSYGSGRFPRITQVSSHEQALDLVHHARFDLVIVAVGADSTSAQILSRQLMERSPQLPVYFLLNNRTLAAGSTMGLPLPTIGRRLFSWWGDSRVFLAMVTSLEDAVNADNDIQSGLVPAFLVVEDSPSYCTRLLIVLYNHIFEQVRFAMRHAAIRENERMARMRMRPKVLVAYNYKDALHYVNKYGNALLGVISDIEFGRNGTLCHTAGLDLAHHIQEHHPAIPILFNSTRGSHKTSARKLNALFHNKTTDDLNETVSLFLREKVGFGEFIFRGPEGNRAATVTTFTELAATVQKLPSSLVAAYVRDDSIRRWLSCQGERSFAQRVGLLCAGEGARDDNELSAAFIDELQQYIDNRHRGKIIALDDVGRLSSRYISSLCSGSLGGKGRGVSFLNTIVQNMDPANQPPGLTIKTPLTAIIGIEEFERLIGLPHIKACMHEQAPYEKIRQAFLQAQLSERVMSRLRVFVHQVSTPVAVRSSSLLEDSVSQPFAGVFETYILPNSHPDAHARLRQLVESIKLVFASLFQPEARAYFASIGQKPEHDRMAVVLQQLVGNRFGRWFYPHISGVAQTYNFYPVGHMKPEDGYAIMAFGLGVYVVEGRTGHRFSPRHPQIDFGSIRDTLNASQVQFYAVDLENRSPDFVRDGEKAALSLRSVSEARENGSLLHCASVYNPDNDQIESDMRKPGPLIVNFADILKHHYLPLAESIDTVLTTLQQATENPVELEFAVELEKKTRGPSALYLLQVRPLVGEQLGHSLSDIAYEPEQVVLFSETALGNGKINDIYDVVIIKPHSYDRLQTKEMVGEVEYFNRLLVDESRQYILIGPGRWGTRDPSLGIPVVWSQIANARAVVEVGLSDTAFDPSQGSHFFHNLTAMNVAYLAVNQSRPREYLRWEFFDTQQAVHETSHFRHLRFEKPLTVQIDGRSKKSVITRS